MTRLIARLATTFGIAAALAGGIAAMPATASAQGWNQSHPARTEINHRIDRQNHRIAAERRQGEISGQEARYLHHRDHHIRMQERRMARMDRNHGHLNRWQVHRLNNELNRNSGAIGR